MKKKSKAILITLVGIVASFIILSSFGGSMTELNHQIKINAPLDKTFAVLSDLESVQHYNPGVKVAKYLDGTKIGVGAARECDLGKDGKVKERVTGYKENEFISMELYEHNWPLEYMKWDTNLSPASDGTIVTQKMQYKMKFGLLGSLLDKLMMKNKLNSTMNSIFSSMKDYIEKR